MTLLAGAATADITPPEGAPMVAFPRGPGQPRIAKGALDPLLVRALVLDDGQEKIALVSVDLCGVRDVSVKRIRETVEKSLPELSGGRVMIAASHTHAGAETLFLFGTAPDDPEVRKIEKKIANTVIAAARDMKPVSLKWSKAELAINHNRRVMVDGKSVMKMEYEEGLTTGVTDPDLFVLRFDQEDGNPLAVIYQYTAHSLTLGRDNEYFSADYPGVASRLVEQKFPGCTAMFMNGAAGNIHPRESMRPDSEAREKIGDILGNAVVDNLTSVKPASDEKISFSSRELTFANRADESLTVGLEVAALRLGGVVMGFVPGEYFVEHQLRFKDKLSPATAMLVGYANGWPGYAPTRESYAEGGYGVDLATGDPVELCRTALPPGAGEESIDALLSLVRGLQ